MSERDGELAAREAPRAAPEPVAAPSEQAVARTRLIAQLVLGLLFILGIVGFSIGVARPASTSSSPIVAYMLHSPRRSSSGHSLVASSGTRYAARSPR